MKKFALIPAFNPDEHLPAICEKLRRQGYSVVVVNDGSDEACEPVFIRAQENATVLYHVSNSGKGAALKTGLRHISKIAGQSDVIVTVDADGQHKPEDVEAVVRAAQAAPGALILGSRSFSGKVPFKSRFGNGITRLVYRAVSHCSVSDTQTGLRAFSYPLIAFLLEIPGERYEYEMNMLLQCLRNGISIVEVPIETVYIDGNASSHFRPFRDSCMIYRELLRFSMSSFAGFSVDYILFCALSRVLLGCGAWAIPFANVLARIVSASVNFSLNRKYVFRDRGNGLSAALRYGLLALGILAGNTLVLSMLTVQLGVNRLVAKLLTEALFFIISWMVQRSFVFVRPARASS